MPKKKPHPPRMTPYANRRSRKYLHQLEVIRLFEAARTTGRHGLRDSTLVWLTYRHGLRASEARALTWGQVDFEHLRLHVQRKKKGSPSTHLLGAFEVGALMRLRPEGATPSTPVFISDRGTALCHSTIYKLIDRAGQAAGLDVRVNTHMLRHSCGFHLTNVLDRQYRKIQKFLGHRDLKHTARYTELDDSKFNDIWDGEIDDPTVKP